MTHHDPAAAWSVIVPLKDLSAAKSRVLLPPPLRSEVARAMALDTVAAVTATPTVRRVLVVGQRDVDLLGLADRPGVDGLVLAADGLNAAIVRGARHLATESPGHPVAVVPADLAAASSADFADALRRCTGPRRAVVADQSGRGTALLTAATPEELTPRFGPDSFARHRAVGAQPITVDPESGLVWDVDTVLDLHRAIGSHTRTVLAGLDLTAYLPSRSETPSPVPA